ncbi:MAG: methylamine dehydrogenase accessory protein MauD [Parvibaculaceae bacterium]
MDPLAIAVLVLWVVVVALGVVVFALARQIGVLFERVAPMGALVTDGGPKVGEASPRFELQTLAGAMLPVGAGGGRSTLIFFLSPTCPMCKKLLPVLKSASKAERGWLDVILASDGERDRQQAFVRQHDLAAFPYVLSSELGMSYRVNRLPFAVLLDGEGIVRAKGLVNSREQLESLFHAKELGVESIQRYLDVQPAE